MGLGRQAHGRLAFSLPVLALLALSFFIVAASPAAATVPLPLTHGWTQVVKDGFNDPGNTHVPFTVEFHGELYVSTMAAGQGTLYSGSKKLGGDIWRTADGIEWEQVGSAGLGNPNNSMFDLVVFKDRLYALSYNMGHEGMEVWVSSDGTDFTKLQGGGFGDPDNDHATPFVFADRLILAVANAKTGVQIWVSDDGESFRQVVAGGLGVPGTTGALRYIDPMDPQPVFKGMLYVGVSNPQAGGELWRTADGIAWERAADGGLGRLTSVSLAPDAVYEDQLYVFGGASGTLEDLERLRPLPLERRHRLGEGGRGRVLGRGRAQHLGRPGGVRRTPLPHHQQHGAADLRPRPALGETRAPAVPTVRVG